MKLVTFAWQSPLGEIRKVGAVRSDGDIVDLTAGRAALLTRQGMDRAYHYAQEDCPTDMLRFIEGGEATLSKAYEVLTYAEELTTSSVNGVQIVFKPEEVTLLTPIPRPNTIRCFSLSERHMLNGIASMQDTEAWGGTKPSLTKLPDEWYNLPTYYKTGSTEIYGPEEIIPWPSITDKFDYELEIGTVIGKRGRHIPIEEGDNYIYGWMMYIDWSTRDFQNREMSVNLGPGLCKDNASTLGPVLITKDELDLYSESFVIKVNDEVWSETKVDFYFPLKKLVEYVSSVQTIFPGDVFSSGTLPYGSGAELKKWIPEGAKVEFVSEHFGTLRNYIGKKGEAQALPASQRPYLSGEKLLDA